VGDPYFNLVATHEKVEIPPNCPPHKASARTDGDGRLPAFPEFSNDWQPEVQLAWFNGYLKLKK
jgi:hypothetical protein